MWGNGSPRGWPVDIATKTIIWSGPNTGLLYGSAQTGTTPLGWTQVCAQNTWYNVSDAGIVSGDLNGITHDGSGQLTVGYDGIYDAIGILTLQTSITNKDVQVAFSVNGTSRTTRAIQQIDLFMINDDEEVIPIADTLDLLANDTVEISLRTIDAGNPTITVDYYTIKLVCIGGT